MSVEIKTVIINPDHLPSVRKPREVIFKLAEIHGRYRKLFPKSVVILKVDKNLGRMANQNSAGYPAIFRGTEPTSKGSGWTFSGWPKSAIAGGRA